MPSQIKVDQITDSSGNLPVDMPNGAKVFGENINPFAGSFKNKIINGNFDIWQRGTSQTTSGYGSADRWFSQNTGSTKVFSRQSFSVGETLSGSTIASKYYSRTVVTSVVGAGSYAQLIQKIESVSTLAGKTATLSFWAKADAPKNIAIELYQSFGTGGSPSPAVSAIGSQLIALTSTWQKYTVTIDIPSISGKVLGTDSNDCLWITFWFEAGSNFVGRTANLGQQSGTFDIAQIQLEEGSVATPFEERHVGEELILCQRYYEKSYNISTALAAATIESAYMSGILSAYLLHAPSIQFKVCKRSMPTCSVYSTYNGAGGNCAEYNISSTFVANRLLVISVLGEKSFEVQIAGGVGTPGNFVRMHWIADAEL